MKASLRLLRTVGVLIILATVSRAATLTWIGGTGDWNAPGNWDGGTVPGPADVAVINSGDVTEDSDTTIAGLTLGNATLEGAGNITITGTLTWTSGTMRGAGRTILASGGSGSMTGPDDKNMERPFENDGAPLLWDNGRLVTRNGITFLNNGVFTILHDATLVDGGGGALLENAGRLNKISSGTVQFTGLRFNQSGVLNFASGTLWLAGGGINSSVIDVPSGGQLRLTADYTQAAGSTVTGQGDVSFENGTQTILGNYTVSGLTAISSAQVNFETEVSLAKAQLSSGLLQATAKVHFTGSLTWTGGGLSGPAQATIESGATATLTGPNDKDVDGPVVNRGTLTFDNGRIVQRGGDFTNAGDMTIAHDADIVLAAGTPVFENTGTLHKLSAGAVHVVGSAFNQDGILDFVAGTLWLSGGGKTTTTIAVPAGGQLRFASDYTFTPASTLTGAGSANFESGSQSIQGAYSVPTTIINGSSVNFENEVTLPTVQLISGRLQGAGPAHFTGNLTWTGGGLSGPAQATIEIGATATLTGPNDKDVERPLLNRGTITFDNGRIVPRAADFTNAGEMTIAHDADIVSGAGAPTFENTGTLHKLSNGAVRFISVTFNQDGVLDFAAGTLQISGGGKCTTAIAVPPGGQLRLNTDYTFTPGSTLSGTGSVSFESGTQNIQGSYNVPTTLISGSSVNFENEVTLPTVQLSSGRLQGAGAVHFIGNLMWTGGGLSGPAQATIEAGATATLTGPNDKDVERPLLNRGTITFDNGRIVPRAADFTNAGEMTIAHDADITNGSGAPTFENTGTLHKLSSGTVRFISVAFKQDGALDFAAGSLLLAGGGKCTTTVAVPSGGQIQFTTDYTFVPGSSLTGAGTANFFGATQNIQGAYNVPTTIINGSTVNFENDVTLPTVQLSSGSLQGAGAAHFTGTLTWTGGALSGPAQATIENGATATLTSPNDKNVERPFLNRGTITFDNGRIVPRNADFTNAGEMTITHDADITNGSGTPTFENTGTLHKLNIRTVQFIGVMFNQDGVLDFVAGTLRLAGNGKVTKSITIPDGGQLRFSADYTFAPGSTLTGPGSASFESGSQSIQGTYTVTGSTVINGSTVSFENDTSLPTVDFGSGSLQGAGAIHFTESLSWTGGSMSGPAQATIESAASATFTSPPDKNIERPLLNAGSVTWNQGRLVLRNADFKNSGTLTIVHDGEMINGSGSPSFENTGIVNKTSAGPSPFTGVFLKQKGTFNALGTIKPTQNLFEQHGTFNPGLSTGAVIVDGDFPQFADGTVRIELAGANNFDHIQINGNATLHGALKVELTGGFVPADGATFTVMDFASHTGSFDTLNGLNLTSTLYLEPTFSSTNLVLTVRALPQPAFINERFDTSPDKLPIFTLSNIAGQNFILEARDSFGPGTTWTDILTNKNSSLTYDFIDTDKTNHPTRYFRARLAP